MAVHKLIKTSSGKTAAGRPHIRARALFNYIFDLRSNLEIGPKCVYHEARGFLLGDDGFSPLPLLLEFAGLASIVSRSSDPISHHVLSFATNTLDPSLFPEIVAMAHRAFDAEGLHFLAAGHGNTDHTHIHVAINRYDPAIGRMRLLEKGFTRRVGARLCAEIETRFGLPPEEKPSTYLLNGAVVFSDLALRRRSAVPDGFPHTGATSLAGTIRTLIAPVLSGTTPASALHDTLAAGGIVVSEGVRGFSLTDQIAPAVRVAASSVHRDLPALLRSGAGSAATALRLPDASGAPDEEALDEASDVARQHAVIASAVSAALSEEARPDYYRISQTIRPFRSVPASLRVRAEAAVDAILAALPDDAAAEWSGLRYRLTYKRATPSGGSVRYVMDLARGAEPILRRADLLDLRDALVNVVVAAAEVTLTLLPPEAAEDRLIRLQLPVAAIARLEARGLRPTIAIGSGSTALALICIPPLPASACAAVERTLRTVVQETGAEPQQGEVSLTLPSGWVRDQIDIADGQSERPDVPLLLTTAPATPGSFAGPLGDWLRSRVTAFSRMFAPLRQTLQHARASEPLAAAAERLRGAVASVTPTSETSLDPGSPKTEPIPGSPATALALRPLARRPRRADRGSPRAPLDGGSPDGTLQRDHRRERSARRDDHGRGYDAEVHARHAAAASSGYSGAEAGHAGGSRDDATLRASGPDDRRSVHPTAEQLTLARHIRAAVPIAIAQGGTFKPEFKAARVLLKLPRLKAIAVIGVERCVIAVQDVLAGDAIRAIQIDLARRLGMSVQIQLFPPAPPAGLQPGSAVPGAGRPAPGAHAPRDTYASDPHAPDPQAFNRTGPITRKEAPADQVGPNSVAPGTHKEPSPPAVPVARPRQPASSGSPQPGSPQHRTPQSLHSSRAVPAAPPAQKAGVESTPPAPTSASMTELVVLCADDPQGLSRAGDLYPSAQCITLAALEEDVITVSLPRTLTRITFLFEEAPDHALWLRRCEAEDLLFDLLAAQRQDRGADQNAEVTIFDRDLTGEDVIAPEDPGAEHGPGF